MPWEQRGAKKYFYLNERREGKPRRRYVGVDGSPAATLTATTADLGRLQRQIEARELQAERARLHEVGVLMERYCDLNAVLTGALLLTAEYYRHHQGEWRRRRVPKGVK